MAVILAVGIAVIPSLYAWFNIFANWDPYGSTGNMQVAVIIEDEGYKYRDIDINVGAEIKSNLEANDLIDWQFVSKKVAMEGIESGKYYAGIEIPKGFSKSLTSIVTKNFKQPQITYYANEKKNAIATKITDKVVQTIQLEVNESFVTTVINVVSSLIDVMADVTKNDASNMLGDLQSKINSINTTISSVQDTVGKFENIMKVSQSLEDIINDDNLSKLLDSTGEALDSGEDLARLIQGSVGALTESADSALGKAADGISGVADTVDRIDTKAAAKTDAPVKDALTKLSRYKAQLEAVRDALQKVRNVLSVDAPALDKLISKLDKSITKVGTLIGALTKVSDGTAQSEVKRISKEIRALAKDVNGFQSDYKKNVKPVVDKSLTSLIDLLEVTGTLVSDLNTELPQLKSLALSLNSSVESGADLVAAIDKLLEDTKKQLTSLSKKIDGLKDSEIINTLQNLGGKNSKQLGAFIACPVIVETTKVYGIETYGSAMAPFYTTLAIWVGGIVLVAVMTTKIKKKKELGEVRLYQNYFGRLLTFLTFSIPQALIICLGDLYFLKIQCYHPAKFILAGVAAAIVFTTFIYSVTFAFGDIGKAIAVICLVLQLGGSGGTFPIDVVPQFFRTMHPYMPFKFVIEAMRECVCGEYGNNFWIELLRLSAYIGIGLVFGLGVKFLVKKPMRFFEKQIEKTDLF